MSNQQGLSDVIQSARDDLRIGRVRNNQVRIDATIALVPRNVCRAVIAAEHNSLRGPKLKEHEVDDDRVLFLRTRIAKTWIELLDRTMLALGATRISLDQRLLLPLSSPPWTMRVGHFEDCVTCADYLAETLRPDLERFSTLRLFRALIKQVRQKVVREPFELVDGITIKRPDGIRRQDDEYFAVRGRGEPVLRFEAPRRCR